MRRLFRIFYEIVDLSLRIPILELVSYTYRKPGCPQQPDRFASLGGRYQDVVKRVGRHDKDRNRLSRQHTRYRRQKARGLERNDDPTLQYGKRALSLALVEPRQLIFTTNDRDFIRVLSNAKTIVGRRVVRIQPDHVMFARNIANRAFRYNLAQVHFGTSSRKAKATHIDKREHGLATTESGRKGPARRVQSNPGRYARAVEPIDACNLSRP